MSIELSSNYRVAVYREPDGSFAVDNSGTPSAFQDIPCQRGSISWDPNPQRLEKNTVYQTIDANDGVVIGHYRPTLSFTTILYPASTRAVDGVASVTSANHALFCLLEGIFGGEISGNQGTTLGTITNAYTVDADTGDGSNWAKHYGIALQDADGIMEIHEVQGVSTDTITTKATPTFTPATAVDALNCTSFYCSESDKSFQFICEGSETDDRWLLMGMQVTSMSINVPTDEFPTITFNFSGVHVKSLAAQAITTATYANYAPVSKTGNFLLATFEDAAGSTTADLCSPSRSINLNVQFSPIICGGETYGINRWKRMHAPPICTMEVVSYFEVKTYFDAVPNESSYYASFQHGNAISEGGFAIVMPNAQLTKFMRTDADGKGAQTLTLEAQQDTNETSELGLSPVRIHFA